VAPLPGAGSYVVSVTATSVPLSSTGSAAFTVMDQPLPGATVSVASITYATSGGRSRNKHVSASGSTWDDITPPNQFCKP